MSCEIISSNGTLSVPFQLKAVENAKKGEFSAV